MKPFFKHCAVITLVVGAVFLLGVFPARGQEPPIDPVRGRALMEKFSRGETLTPEEQAYLDRVRQAIRERASGRQMPLSTNDWSTLVPLIDLSAKYKGEDGGLYGGGQNEPPQAHRAAHLKESDKIRPLDANGDPAAEGKIGLITIGFSGFGTRWVVQSQMRGAPELNYDADRGEVRAPLVLWGPYLWAQGNSPRKLDGLVWTQDDVRADRLHPNEAGVRKTTALLLNFFKTNEGASRWFLKAGEKVHVEPLPK